MDKKFKSVRRKSNEWQKRTYKWSFPFLERKCLQITKNMKINIKAINLKIENLSWKRMEVL